MLQCGISKSPIMMHADCKNERGRNACEMGDVGQGDVVAIWGCGAPATCSQNMKCINTFTAEEWQNTLLCCVHTVAALMCLERRDCTRTCLQKVAVAAFLGCMETLVHGQR